MYQGLMDLFQMTRYKIFKDVLEVERQTRPPALPMWLYTGLDYNKIDSCRTFLPQFLKKKMHSGPF